MIFTYPKRTALIIHICTAACAALFAVVFGIFGYLKDLRVIVGGAVFAAALVFTDVMLSAVVSGRDTSGRRVTLCAAGAVGALAALLATVVFTVVSPLAPAPFFAVLFGAVAVIAAVFGTAPGSSLRRRGKKDPDGNTDAQSPPPENPNK
ncbi:MAG: hypothetical protein K6C36_07540 [Clostridia bacterium]|nr:hypothetical protein [Clostridia bacterium]